MVPEAELREAITEQNPIWAVRVTLTSLRSQGHTFDSAWYAALQRLRVQPNMTPDDIEELMECKAWLLWAREWWKWAYELAEEGPPELVDGEVFGRADDVTLHVRS